MSSWVDLTRNGRLCDKSRDSWVKRLFQQCRKRAAKNDMDFNITIEYLTGLWNRQKGCCLLTGLPFIDTTVEKGARRPFIPSIDRRNNSKGYVKGNTRLVLNAVNMALFTWGVEVFDRIVKARVDIIEDSFNTNMSKLVTESSLQIEEEPLISRAAVCRGYGITEEWFKERIKWGAPVPQHEERSGIGYKFVVRYTNKWFEDYERKVLKRFAKGTQTTFDLLPKYIRYGDNKNILYPENEKRLIAKLRELDL